MWRGGASRRADDAVVKPITIVQKSESVLDEPSRDRPAEVGDISSIFKLDLMDMRMDQASRRCSVMKVVVSVWKQALSPPPEFLLPSPF